MFKKGVCHSSIYPSCSTNNRHNFLCVIIIKECQEALNSLCHVPTFLRSWHRWHAPVFLWPLKALAFLRLYQHFSGANPKLISIRTSSLIYHIDSPSTWWFSSFIHLGNSLINLYAHKIPVLKSCSSLVKYKVSPYLSWTELVTFKIIFLRKKKGNHYVPFSLCTLKEVLIWWQGKVQIWLEGLELERKKIPRIQKDQRDASIKT